MSDTENRIGNVFALRNLIFQCKGQQIMAKSSLHLVFANVLLECSHAYLLCIVCGFFSTTLAELLSCNKDHMAYKTKIFTMWPFIEVF